MNIQLSVTIWTVICFCLLMFILHHLLFKPVLALMDARKQRMKQAAEKKAEYEAKAKEYDLLAQEQADRYAKEQRAQTAGQLEELRAQSKRELELAREQRVAQVEAYRVTAEQMHQDIWQTLEGHTVQLAESFAQNLIKD